MPCKLQLTMRKTKKDAADEDDEGEEQFESVVDFSVQGKVDDDPRAVLLRKRRRQAKKQEHAFLPYECRRTFLATLTAANLGTETIHEPQKILESREFELLF